MNVEKSPGSERLIRCTFDDPDNLESYSTYDNDFKNKIVSSICLTEKSYEGCILFSSVPIKKVEVFPVCSRYKIFKKNAKPYCKYNKPISPGYGILFQVGLPEGMPQYKAVITRFDYRKTGNIYHGELR